MIKKEISNLYGQIKIIDKKLFNKVQNKKDCLF